MMTVRQWTLAAAGLAILALCGCRKTAPPVAHEDAKPVIRNLNALDPATLGSVSGIVKFTGTAPAPVRIDMAAEAGCGRGEQFSEDYVVRGGFLANVYVSVKSGPAAAMAQGASWIQPVVLDVKDCRFVPHVAAVTVGQRITFHNSDGVAHTVRVTPDVAGNAAVDITLAPAGVAEARVFRKPEVMMPVRCGKHPWMSAFVNVSPTPFFAVTGPDGKFELKGLPAGDYTLSFVQEKMGERSVTVTVKPQATSAVEVSYSF